MRRDVLRKSFDHDDLLDEYYKKSIDKKPMGKARFQLIKGKKRMGKLYWDEIRIVYGGLKKPFIEIKTLNGFKLIVHQNEIEILPDNQMEDTCYIGNLMPLFDRIEFYSEFEWILDLNELEKVVKK